MAKWQETYERRKPELLKDLSINEHNRKIFAEFLEFEEYKLKRKNNLRALDEGSYNTMDGYVTKLRKVNEWFGNKSWYDLTKEDIKRVYDDLEDGKIKRENGRPYENLDDSYYSKVFKSKPFEIAGKADLAREVISFTTKPNKEVRFITEEDFRKIVDNAFKPQHRLLFWLAWDYGENINSLLRLRKRDFTRQPSHINGEPEYRLNLKKDILKRSRKARSEISNYKETVKLLDQELSKFKDDDLLFTFDYRNAKKIIDRVVARTDVKCIPNKEKVTWKDLRSGMACDLLKKGWTSDEVNARLGHRPSSAEIDKYINFLAIDRHISKKKMHQFEMEKLNEEMLQVKRTAALEAKRNEILEQQMKEQQKQIESMQEMMQPMIEKFIAQRLREGFKFKDVEDDQAN